MFDGYADHFNEEVRLVILKILAEQSDGRLNDSMMLTVLETFAINRTREYLRTQLRWLADEGQAITISKVGTVWISELTQQGEHHLARKVLIEGIKRPSRPKA
ncbi:MAG: hypothetical protein CSA70_03610 [Rhodobacterales bacterium]|nr:MAG: hypothetical protein CSA70_03610 [Rhodobacterales bacterium]